MRICMVILLVLCSGLSGCFGGDELFEEKRGIPGGLALACLQDDKFEKMQSLTIEATFSEEPNLSDLLRQPNSVSTPKIRLLNVDLH